MSGWLYVASCVGVPILVGTAMYVLFSVWDRRRRKRTPARPLPVIDYMI
jgi:hypothetical protein